MVEIACWSHEMKTVSVARDFTRFPSGRYKQNGDTSGEAFRERFLEEPIARGEKVIVELDGTVGYGSSFLEEAFGGLVRKLRLPAETIFDRLEFRAEDRSLIDEVKDYIREEARKLTH